MLYSVEMGCSAKSNCGADGGGGGWHGRSRQSVKRDLVPTERSCFCGVLERTAIIIAWTRRGLANDVEETEPGSGGTPNDNEGMSETSPGFADTAGNGGERV